MQQNNNNYVFYRQTIFKIQL